MRPVPYPIPSDGPAGDLLKANGRGWMRPGHTHMWVRADGYKELITHVFDEETDYLHEDAVFGVRDSLVRRFEPDDNGELATTFDIVLDRVLTARRHLWHSARMSWRALGDRPTVAPWRGGRHRTTTGRRLTATHAAVPRRAHGPGRAPAIDEWSRRTGCRSTSTRR